MNIQDHISLKANELLKKEFDTTFESFDFQPTRKDFDGDITLVVFSLLKKITGTDHAPLGA